MAGSLPQALAKRGHKIMVIAPRYMNGTPSDKLYQSAIDTGKDITVYCYGAAQTARLFHERRNDVDYVFVDHPSFAREGGIYSNSQGVPFHDNPFRFTLLSHVACEVPLQLQMGMYPYGEDVIFVANDWSVNECIKFIPYISFKNRSRIVLMGN